LEDNSGLLPPKNQNDSPLGVIANEHCLKWEILLKTTFRLILNCQCPKFYAISEIFIQKSANGFIQSINSKTFSNIWHMPNKMAHPNFLSFPHPRSFSHLFSSKPAPTTVPQKVEADGHSFPGPF
jgi:hypothetical protein